MPANEITRLSTTTNAAVVQLPERCEPGIVIQGDSLRNLLSLVCDAEHKIDQGDMHECRAILGEVQEILGGYVEHFKSAARAAGGVVG